MAHGTEILREQWTELRRWIEDSGLLAHRREQSVLEAWNVHELVTHIGRSFLALTVLGPDPAASPITLHDYLSKYAASAQEIADGTKELARSFADDLLGGIDNCARLGFRTLDSLHVDVVRGPRGAILLDDFVVSRLIELVVHGDDLARSVPSVAAPPLVENAVQAVSDAFVAVYVEVTGQSPTIDDRLAWIRRASGRTPDPDAALPLL
jgi:mycothiol maleylpyruvate isomerase-like protein